MESYQKITSTMWTGRTSDQRLRQSSKTEHNLVDIYTVLHEDYKITMNSGYTYKDKGSIYRPPV